MSPIAQRYAVVNFIKNKGDTSKPEHMTSDQIERLIFERGLILDPTTSRDGINAAMVLLNRGQRVAFQIELQRFVGSRHGTRSAVPVADTDLFDQVSAPADILCKVLLKVIGKWDPKL